MHILKEKNLKSITYTFIFGEKPEHNQKQTEENNKN
jgi:hypothetical protein